MRRALFAFKKSRKGAEGEEEERRSAALGEAQR